MWALTKMYSYFSDLAMYYPMHINWKYFPDVCQDDMKWLVSISVMWQTKKELYIFVQFSVH